MKSQLLRRYGIAVVIAATMAATIALPAFAAFAWTMGSGPTISSVTGTTWTVTWTINVTTLSNPDKTVCVSVTPAVVSPAICGETTGLLTCTLTNVPNGSQLAWDISSFTANSGCTGSQITGPTGTISPLAVTLAEFSAGQQGDAVLLTWETNSELNNRGFNLYRGTSAAAPDRQLNETLIPSQSQGNPGGFIYTWEDRADLVPGTAYFYWVEDVDINGAATMHGPVSVDYMVPTAVTLSGIQASPAAAGPVAPLVGTLLALLAPLAGALAVRRRRA